METTDHAPRSAGLRRRRFRGVFGALALTGVLAVTACSGSIDAAGSNGGGEPQSGGTLRIALLSSPESLDPHLNTSFAASNYGNSVFDKLTWQDPETGEIGPWLATSWEVNDTNTEFTFTLRDGVTFSDGTPFNADIVKKNFDQYVFGDPALGIKPNGATHLRSYLGSEVVSDNVVKIVFDAPSASFLQFISYSGNNQPGIIGQKTLSSNAEQRLDPANIVGTGPFVVTEYVPRERTVLTKRPDYDWAAPGLNHEGPAYLDKVEFVTIPEASVRTGALQSGEVQAAFDILPTDEAVLEAQGYDITSRTIAGLNLGWNINTSLEPTNDINVRRAIVRATNRPGFKDTILAPSEGQAKSVLAHHIQGAIDYTDDVLGYDLDESRRLLDEAGWKVGADGIREKDGKKLTLKATGHYLVPNSRYTYESIQASLKEIGVDLDFQFDASNIPTDQINKEYHLINTNRSRNDPAILNVNFNPDRGNSARISADFPGRQEIVDTLEALESTLDPTQRAVLTERAQELVLDEYVLFDPVFEPSQVAASKGVYGLDLDATSRLHFLRTWIDQG
ncbi:ABC transporter substrate-binding protein [Rhodococcus zopfii]|uniref:ABC transporter substrate-binding protein n=1 Tax=Rhodococcus zopfii TaxID=43772 RepID=UPI00111148A9|nr:ABC transporter substrate-binding protein [Rhodococcus zopfii]